MTRTVGFLLFPRFQMLAFVLATETLRLANKVAGQPLFGWRSITRDGRPVSASNGLAVIPDATISEAGELSLLLVCAGYEPLDALDRRTSGWLRQRARRGQALGGLDTGSVVLAELGLLSGYRAVLHWEADAAFRETYPDIAVDESIYVLDRDRLTAAGGTATADAMLTWIARTQSADLAAKTATGLVHGRVREGGEKQRSFSPLPQDPALSGIIEVMRAHIEEPLPMTRIAGSAGLGSRKMLRLFQAVLGQTPSAYYLGLRLDHARDLLTGTSLPAAAVGLACGFGSPAWFNRAYRTRFGIPPLQHRRLLRSSRGAGQFP